MIIKPKILLFIDWYKPGFKAGGPIRSISNLVSQLYAKFDFYIVTSNTDYLETVPYATIKTNEWNKVDDAKVYYLSKENQKIKTIKQLIKEINPKLIYCNSLYSPFFTIIPIYLANKLNIKSILAIRGMLSEGSLSVKSKKKKLFLIVIKILGLFKKCTFHATTQEEKTAIKNTFGSNTEIIVAQNLPEKKNISFQEKKKEINQLKLVNIGRIAPEKNTLYALEALKEVKSNVIFDIYGPIYNKEYWKKCKSIINQLPPNIVVNYKGVLPHSDLDNTLKNYHVFFSPSTGENFGHSILEGMTNSCVPVISNKTPWQNLALKKVGFDIDLNKQTLFAEKIDNLARMNEVAFNQLSLNAYNFAQNIINNPKLKEDYYKLFQLKN